MRVEIDSDVFASNTIDELGLHSLFYLGYRGRCNLIVLPPCVSTGTGAEHPVKQWLASVPPRTRLQCELALDQGIKSETHHPSTTRILVSPTQQSNWNHQRPVLSIANALQFLGQPFEIIVENARNDRAFLLAVSDPDDRVVFEERESQGWIKFQHTGGLGEMLIRVQQIQGDLTKALRSWVLFDSDKLQPNQNDPNSERVRAACDNCVPFHQLRRRAIENYLPLEVLGSWAKRESRAHMVALFKAFNFDQRAHYNMKRGFAGDGWRQDGLTSGALFDGLDKHILNQLHQGFGDNIADLFNDPDLRVQSWYAADDRIGELGPAIKLLLSLL